MADTPLTQRACPAALLYRRRRWQDVWLVGCISPATPFGEIRDRSASAEADADERSAGARGHRAARACPGRCYGAGRTAARFGQRFERRYGRRFRRRRPTAPKRPDGPAWRESPNRCRSFRASSTSPCDSAALMSPMPLRSATTAAYSTSRCARLSVIDMCPAPLGPSTEKHAAEHNTPAATTPGPTGRKAPAEDPNGLRCAVRRSQLFGATGPGGRWRARPDHYFANRAEDKIRQRVKTQRAVRA